MLWVAGDPFWVKVGARKPEEPPYLSSYASFRITAHCLDFNRINVEKFVLTFDPGVQKQVT